MIKKYFVTRSLKNRLEKTFKAGGIYITHKSGDRTHYITPKIHAVDLLNNPNRLQYVFTVPLGMDPKEVIKKEWLFMQQYGENIELKQDNKRFTLTIYVEKMATDNKYIFEVVSDHIEGLKLPIYCGKDVNNQHIAYDMVSNPHLLIAGESGGGKSTQVRQVLTTLIKTISPNKLHFYLADMKWSEFHLFRRVEHVKKVCTRVSDLMTVLTKLKKV